MSSELTGALDRTNRRTDGHTDGSSSVLVDNSTNGRNHEVSVNRHNVENECVDGTEEDEITVLQYTTNMFLCSLRTEVHKDTNSLVLNMDVPENRVSVHSGEKKY